MSSVLLPKNVDLSLVEISETQINKWGGKTARIRYNGGQKLYLQTPKLRTPFGLNCWEEKDEDGKVTKQRYSINLSFEGYELDDEGKPRDRKVREWYDLVTSLNNRIIEHATVNSTAYLGQPDAPRVVVEALFRNPIREHLDKVTKKPTGKYHPTMGVGVGFWEDRFTVDCFDTSGNKLEDVRKALPAGVHCASILELDAVTFGGAKFGPRYRLRQTQVTPQQSIYGKYSFVADSEDEDAVDEEEDAASADESEEEVVNEVPDSDDSDSEDGFSEEEDEPVPIPPPSPKKKGRRRRKKTT
jgi:hypothetical protein